MTFENPEVFEQYARNQKSIIVMMGHLGSWELAAAHFAGHADLPLTAIYKTLSNPYFDRLFQRLRTRHGNHLYEMKSAFRQMVRDKEKLSLTTFIADQTAPKNGGRWIEFLNQETLVFVGAEKIAKALDRPVVYVSVRRKRRGKYQIYAETITQKPRETQELFITKSFYQLLEKDIQNYPETWLWSHRRWKHSVNNR